MQIRYIEIWKLHGASSIDSGASSLPVAKIGDPEISATLTTDPNSHFFHIDKASVISMVLLNGLFGKQMEGQIDEQIAEKMETIEKERIKKFGTGVFLVIKGETKVLDVNLEKHRSMGKFGVALEAFDKEPIRDQFKNSVQSVLLAIALNLKGDADRRIKSIGKVLYLVDSENENPIYSYSLKLGAVGLSLAKTVNSTFSDEVATNANSILDGSFPGKISNLLVSSLDSKKDKLESFIAAWSALEIFINSTFKTTYKEHWSTILKDGAPDSAKPVLNRLDEIMKDKYRLADKFSIIVSILDQQNAALDTKTFGKIKETRDRLFHTANVDEHLPTEEVHKLTLKLLKLHLGAQGEGV